MTPIRIGILLDSFLINKWQEAILSSILMNDKLSLELVIINNSDRINTKKSALLYRMLMKLDRTFFKLNSKAYEKINVKTHLSNTPIFSINQTQGKFYTILSEEDTKSIVKENLDIIIRFGFGILKGDILDAAKYGIWSLHHGDNAVNRGGPPGFWEVVNQEATTGITLQKITPNLDGGQVIGKSFIKTDVTSFTRNLNAALWAGVELICTKLDELTNDTLEIDKSSKFSFYSHPLYKKLSNSEALTIFSKFWLRRLKEALQNKLKPQKWSLAYYFNTAGEIEQSIFRYKKLSGPKKYDWADPFVVKKEGLFYLFFEELNRKVGKAHISCIQFDANGTLIPDSNSVVVTEDHHLSYPFTFFWEDNYYMLPEAADSKKLWLYKSTDFPNQWEKFQLLLNKEVFDATLFLHDQVWYLFTTQKNHESDSADQYLNIYYSDDLLSDNWQAHPKNPIKRTVIGSRPAGKVFEYEGKLIRPAQIGAPKYGYGIHFYEIVKLSKHEFEEVLVSSIKPNWKKELLACHTFNSTMGFSVIDLQTR